MKKLFFAAALLISCAGFAQLKVIEQPKDKGVEIGKVAPLGMASSVMTKFDEGYALAYKDIRYQTVDEVKMIPILNSEFEDLYNLIISKLDSKEAGVVTIELSGDKIDLDFQKNMGVMSMQFQQYIDKAGSVKTESPFFTKKQIQKLFGKK